MFVCLRVLGYDTTLALGAAGGLETLPPMATFGGGVEVCDDGIRACGYAGAGGVAALGRDGGWVMVWPNACLYATCYTVWISAYADGPIGPSFAVGTRVAVCEDGPYPMRCMVSEARAVDFAEILRSTDPYAVMLDG